jgi:phage-related protein
VCDLETTTNDVFFLGFFFFFRVKRMVWVILSLFLNEHYTIKQFYWRINSVGVRHAVRRYNSYRRNTLVGISIVGNSLFRC